MSSPALPREPAWQGQPPNSPVFVPAVDSTQELICEQLNISGPVFELHRSSAGLTGYYRTDADSQNPALFIKIVTHEQSKSLIKANEFSTYVAKRHIPTACLLKEYTKALDSKHTALSYHYHEGRFAKNDADDLAHLGAVLARLHQALSQYSHSEKVKTYAEQRQALLRETQKAIETSHNLPAQARQIIQNSNLLYPPTTWSEQVIHGDLNYGNVLFPLDSPDQPLILDFEDSVLSWHSPLVELAFVIERFILSRNNDDRQAWQLSKAFIRAYQEGFSVKPPSLDKKAKLTDVLRVISSRSLILLAALSAEGAPVSQKEWHKFIALYEQVSRRNKLVLSIENLLRQ